MIKLELHNCNESEFMIKHLLKLDPKLYVKSFDDDLFVQVKSKVLSGFTYIDPVTGYDYFVARDVSDVSGGSWSIPMHLVSKAEVK